MNKEQLIQKVTDLYNQHFRKFSDSFKLLKVDAYPGEQNDYVIYLYFKIQPNRCYLTDWMEELAEKVILTHIDTPQGKLMLTYYIKNPKEA